MTLSARRVAAIYDIHGNLPALDAVLAEIDRESVDLVLVGGDVAAGPMPIEVLDRLRGLRTPMRYIRGNGDRTMVEMFDETMKGGAPAPLEWAATQIGKSERDFLASFEESLAVEVEGLGAVRFCHGSPRSDEEILTSVTSDERLRRILQNVGEPIVVCGHTHIQFDRALELWRVINAGSVGMPYEHPSGARWLLLGPGIELRTTTYDIDAAAALLAMTAYPEIDEWISSYLRHPASSDEASQFFEEMALKREAEGWNPGN